MEVANLVVVVMEVIDFMVVDVVEVRVEVVVENQLMDDPVRFGTYIGQTLVIDLGGQSLELLDHAVQY